MPVVHLIGVGRKCAIDLPFGGHEIWLNCRRSSCAKALTGSRFHRDLFGEANLDFPCPEGEELYLQLYEDVNDAVKRGDFESGWSHFDAFGREQGNVWRCLLPKRTWIDYLKLPFLK